MFTVKVIRDDGKTITIPDVKARDTWHAQTMVWFQMPEKWADAHAVSYEVEEVA